MLPPKSLCYDEAMAIMEEVIAERKFVLGASQNRVWSLIGKVMLGSMPGLMGIEIIDENNIRGLLKTMISSKH